MNSLSGPSQLHFKAVVAVKKNGFCLKEFEVQSAIVPTQAARGLKNGVHEALGSADIEVRVVGLAVQQRLDVQP